MQKREEVTESQEKQRESAIPKSPKAGKPQHDSTQSDIERNQGTNPGNPQGETGGNPGGTGDNQGEG